MRVHAAEPSAYRLAVFQLAPPRDDQMTMHLLPGRPTVPAFSNPLPAAVSAATPGGPQSALSCVSYQARPPSVEYSANGTVSARLGAVPVATITFRCAATFCSAAAIPPAWVHSLISRHCVPSDAVHTAGARLTEPTTTNAGPAAVTPSSPWRRVRPDL
jgi:hypothetical protein